MRIELTPGCSNVIRFPVEERAKPSLDLLRDIAPLSADLSAVASAGLQALDYLDKSRPSPEAWRAQQLALTEQAKTPKAELLLMIVAPVQQLIACTAE